MIFLKYFCEIFNTSSGIPIKENPTISPHTLSDVVYVFHKNGGTLLHLEDGNNLKLVGNKEKNKCQSKLT
jgi:hypothetical protein